VNDALATECVEAVISALDDLMAVFKAGDRVTLYNHAKALHESMQLAELIKASEAGWK